jgi:hypothetical protein
VKSAADTNARPLARGIGRTKLITLAPASATLAAVRAMQKGRTEAIGVMT